MKLINCFIFFNEIKHLELRLEYEYHYYHKFVIIESTKTFAGKDKLLYFDKYKKRFEKYMDKIVYYVVTDMPKVIQKSYIGTRGRIAPENRWPLEIHQRNCIKRVLDALKLEDDDIVFINDCDEIPFIDNIDKIKKISHLDDTIFVPNNFYDFRTQINTEPQYSNLHCTFAANYATIKKHDIHSLRLCAKKLNKIAKINTINGGGIHLSHMYGGYYEYLQHKLENFAHSETMNGKVSLDTTTDYVEKMEKFIEIHKEEYDIENIHCAIPDFIKKNPKKYLFLFRLKKK